MMKPGKDLPDHAAAHIGEPTVDAVFVNSQPGVIDLVAPKLVPPRTSASIIQVVNASEL